MRDLAERKKKYSSPVVSAIGTLSNDTKAGSWWRKRSGPGDQYIFTDPPNCWDGHFYNNCEDTSA
jgi:hypothetical protein